MKSASKSANGFKHKSKSDKRPSTKDGSATKSSEKGKRSSKPKPAGKDKDADNSRTYSTLSERSNLPKKFNKPQNEIQSYHRERETQQDGGLSYAKCKVQ